MNSVIWFQAGRNGPFRARALSLQRSLALSVFPLVRDNSRFGMTTPRGGRFSSLERRLR